MGKHKKRMLVSLQDFLKAKSAKIVGGLGLGGGIRTLFRQATVIREPERALKSGDRWVVKRLGERLVAHNRVLNTDVRIPWSVVRPTLRRIKGIPYMNATKLLDFLVVSQFSGLEDFMDEEIRAQFLKDIQLWQKYVEKRMTHIMLVRKFDLSAPGTTLLAYYSDEPAVPAEFWAVRSASLRKDELKIITLWYNSTPNMIQMFLGRTETRGTYMKLDVSMIKNSLILNPDALGKREKRELVSTFNSLSKRKFPSVMTQLRDSFDGRVVMDEAILKALGYSETRVNTYTRHTYPLLYDELSRLKALMK